MTVSLAFFYLVIFSCTELLFFLLLSAGDSNHFLDFSAKELSIASLLDIHMSNIYAHTHRDF